MKTIFRQLTLLLLVNLLAISYFVKAQGIDSTLKPLPPSKCLQIGSNININTFDNTSHPFVDFFKLNEGWTPINTTLASLRFDRDGYVTNGLQVSTKFSLKEVTDSMKFTIFWDGFAKDTSKLPISVAGIKLIPNTYNKTSTGGSVKVIKGFDYGYISIVNSAATSDSSRLVHIRNIRVIREGFENTYLTNPFNPEFIKQILPQSKIIINAALSNLIEANVNTTWKERVLTSSFSQSTNVSKQRVNIAYEYGIQLANITGKDLWINIPYNVNEEYVTQMARLHKAQLNKGIKVYVEYSYETWNFGTFKAYSYFSNILKDPIKVRDTMVQITKKSWSIWRQAFGTDSNRVNRVVGCQLNYWPGTGSYLAVDVYGKGPGHFEVVAVAIGLGLGTKEDEEAKKIGLSITASQLNNYILQSWNNGSIRSYSTDPIKSSSLLAYSKEAKRAGAKLIVYGGDLEFGYDPYNKIPEAKKNEANMHKSSLEPLFNAVFDTLKQYGFSEFNFFGLNGSKSGSNYTILGGTFTSSTILSNDLQTDAKNLIVKSYTSTQDCYPVTSTLENNDEKLVNDVKLFPNPTTGAFQVDLVNLTSKDMFIQCFNSMGQLIYQGPAKPLEEMNFLKSEPNGIYNLQFTIQGNKINKKIMKY